MTLEKTHLLFYREKRADPITRRTVSNTNEQPLVRGRIP